MSVTSSNSFPDCLVTHFHRIVKESNCRLSAVKRVSAIDTTDEKIRDLLMRGIWYPQDYYRETQRLELRRPEWFQDHLRACGRLPITLSGNFFWVEESSGEFRTISSKTPSEGLHSINPGSGLHLLDCGLIYSLAFSRALNEFLGWEKFDALFTTDPKLPFKLSPRTPNEWGGFLFDSVDIDNAGELQKGDKCHFSNIPDYLKKHPLGEAEGYNVLYRGGQNPFLGFGLPSEGSTQEGVERALLAAYNADPIEGATDSIGTHRIEWDDFQQKEGNSKYKRKDGKLTLAVIRPLTEKIHDWQKLTLEELKESL